MPCFKHSGQNFIFFVFLYFAMLCLVSKHSDQNLIFFVFLYFAMLCTMFQNIAVKISFSLYFFILLCYAMFKHSGQYCIFLYFSQTKKLEFCLLCFETWHSIAKQRVLDMRWRCNDANPARLCFDPRWSCGDPRPRVIY